MQKKFIGYCRVSTDRQGRSGLGLEAQQSAIRAHVEGSQGTLLAPVYVEVESGKRNDRPELAKALAHAKRAKATLVIAKLDRLARNMAFIANLMEAGVDFIACDMPVANKLTLHIIAAVAEDETRRISERTKAALKAKVERDGQWDRKAKHHLVPGAGQKLATQAAAKAKADAAVDAAQELLPTIEGLRAEGVTSLNGLAKALNARHIKTRRGGTWTATGVRRVLERVTD